MASKFSLFLKELKRRKVFHVAGAYLVVGSILGGAANDFLPNLGLPSWTVPFVITLIVLGLPIALVLAWAFEVRPEESRSADPVPDELLPTDSAPKSAASPAFGGPAPAKGEAFAFPVDERASVVVLPFENLSPDPDNAFFADGLTEEIIADLSRVKAVRVISRTSAMTFKGTSRTLPSIAQELNVGFVLEGSVRRERESLRITAQFIDAATDAHLWAEKYSGTLDEVFDLQEKLSRRIVNALEVTLSPEENRRLSARPIPDVRAHDIWLRARQHALTVSIEGLEKAKELVEQALSLSPDSALLHATLGWIHGIRYVHQLDGAEETLGLARQHATKALELDPELPWSAFSMGVVHLREGDLQSLIRWSGKALESERDSHTLAALSLYLARAGRLELARRHALEAVSLDPLTWLPTFCRAHVEVMDGAAEVMFPKIRELEKRFAPGELWSGFEVGYAAFQAGREEEAVDWLRKAAGAGESFYSVVSRLMVHVLEGDLDSASTLLDSPHLPVLARRDGLGSCIVGGCLARLGRMDEAFDWLDHGVGRGFTNHRFLGEHDRLLEPLRRTQRFEELLDEARKKEAALKV